MFEKENNWEEFPGLYDRVIHWVKIFTKNKSEILSVDLDNDRWVIRLNDFPDEPCYTLLINGVDVIHFNDWPVAWKK
jgi:hypothetical protein